MYKQVGNLPGFLAHFGNNPLVGRTYEMNEAYTIWQRAVSGEGHILMIYGEPGVGKTSFIHNLASVAEHDGALVIKSECYAQGSAPYLPIKHIINDGFEANAYANLGLSNEILSDLLVIVPSLSTYFPELLPTQNPDPRSVQQRIFESFTSFCSALSNEKPLLLFVDDVHWADSDTLYLLLNLARQAHKLPLMIAMIYNDAELDAATSLSNVLLDLNRERLAFQLKLERLGQRETHDLLAAIFGEAITPEFLDGIYRHTDGNPFFVEEICKALIEEGQLSFRDGDWHFPEITKIIIPRTIRTAIKARVDKLPKSAQETLNMAAILGYEFDFETLKRASSFDDETLITALESAVHAQLIAEIQSSQAKALRFGFVHPLIPSTLRESIIHVRRRRLHQRAIQAIAVTHPDDFEALAYQCSQAGEDGLARDYYIRAGRRSQSVAPSDAANYYQAALENWPEEEDQPGKAEILAQLGHIRYLIADISGAMKCFEDALALFEKLQNHTQRGEMERMIGRMHWEQANRELALKHYFQALAIQEQGHETPELARAMSQISHMYTLAPNDDLGIGWGQRALNLAERLRLEDVVVESLKNIGTCYACAGNFEKGIEIIQESLQRAIDSGLSWSACNSYYSIGVMRQRQCRYTDARESMQDLHSMAKKVHAKNYVNLAIYRMTWIDWLQGNWGSVLSNRSLTSAFTSSLYTTWAKRIFAMIDLDLGKVEDGLRGLEESLPSALSASDMQTTISHFGQLVRAYAASGQTAKTLETIIQILDFVSDIDHVSGEQIMPLLFACQQVAKMNQPGIENIKQRCLAHAHLLAKRYDTGEAAAALAEAQGYLSPAADSATAVENFRQAADKWESIGRPYDQARAFVGLGHALVSLGDTAKARTAWNQAMQLFDSLADQLDPENQASFLDSPLVRDVRKVLKLSPLGKYGKYAKPGPGGLTEREIDVLKLVSQGLTNKQIAEHLVVSPLTINAHVRSIFNKLGVTTRTAAVRRSIELGLV